MELTKLLFVIVFFLVVTPVYAQETTISTISEFMDFAVNEANADYFNYVIPESYTQEEKEVVFAFASALPFRDSIRLFFPDTTKKNLIVFGTSEQNVLTKSYLDDVSETTIAVDTSDGLKLFIVGSTSGINEAVTILFDHRSYDELYNSRVIIDVEGLKPYSSDTSSTGSNQPISDQNSEQNKKLLPFQSQNDNAEPNVAVSNQRAVGDTISGSDSKVSDRKKQATPNVENDSNSQDRFSVLWWVLGFVMLILLLFLYVKFKGPNKQQQVIVENSEPASVNQFSMQQKKTFIYMKKVIIIKKGDAELNILHF